MDPVDDARLRASAHRHRLDHRPRRRGGPWLAVACARSATRVRAAARARLRQRPRHARRPGRRVLDALRLRAAVLSSRVVDGRSSTAAARAMRRVSWRRRWRPPSGLRASGERRVGLLFVVGEERGSDGAVAANTIPNSARFLINGEPTDSMLATATRGRVARAPPRRRPRGPLRRARARRVGDRQARSTRWCDCAGCRFQSTRTSARPSTPSA